MQKILVWIPNKGDNKMTNYVLVYTGSGMPESPEAQQAVMAACCASGEMGEAVVDGGNPFGASKSVSADGVSDGAVGSPAATGYTVISADSLDAAVAKVGSHPHVAHGGQVTVYETFEM
ncbi:MAG: hypothetical protein ACI9EW_000355 [Cellvibrionaceae bacterium]